MSLTSSPQPTDILGVFVIKSRPDTTFPRVVWPKAGVVASSCNVAFLPQDGICCRLLKGHRDGRGLEGLLVALLGPCSRSSAPLWATPPHLCTSGGALCAAQACFNGNAGDTLKTASESPYPQQEAEQPLLPTSAATRASLYLKIRYDCNQEGQSSR